MTRHRPLAPAFAAIALLAAAGQAANHGVEALPGDRFTAAISPAGDADAYVVPLGTGSRLSVDVRAAPGGNLLPTLAVRAPSGPLAEVDGLVRGGGTPRIGLKNLPILDTGGWAVIVGGEGGTTGAYEISFAAKSPTRFARRGLAVPAGEDGRIPFTAGDGDQLAFSIRSRGGALPSGVTLRDPSGADVPFPEGAVVARGPRISARSIPLSGPFGTWELRVRAAEGGSALVDAALQVRSPKPRKLHAVLGAEPRPSTLSPRVGKAGSAFALGGKDFVPGARVRFGGTWTAGAAVDGGTTVTGAVPDGAEAQAGLQVVVVVANPDGQENPLSGFFQYLGPPKPESVTPVFQPPEGGFPLVVRGRNFRPGFTLSIGGVPVAGATLNPLGEILCTSPPHAIGTASVAVTDEFGRTGTLPSGITYIGPPVPQSVAPASSTFTGGRVHTLSGQSFQPGLRVFVDGVECEDVVFVDSARLRFPMPPGPAGTFDVSVADDFGRTAAAAGAVRRRGPLVDASAEAVPAAPPGHEYFARAAALGDLDGDGVADLLLSTPYPAYDGTTYRYLPAARVLRNDGGVFTDATGDRLAGFAHALDLGQASLVLLGDLDGGAGNEIVLSAAYPISSQAYTFTRGGTVYSYATLGYYGGTYADPDTYVSTRILAGATGEPLADATATRMPAPGSTPYRGFGERWQAAAGALGDLDGDGDDDMVLSAPGFLVKGTVTSSTYYGGVTYLIQSYAYAGSTRILRNDGKGAFATRAGDMPAITFMNGYYASRVAEEFDASAVSLGDLDGDGDADLLLARSYPKLVYHLDTGSGSYSVYYTTALRLLDNDGTGRFVRDVNGVPPPEGAAVPGDPEFWQGTASALGDLDGDGDLDLVLGRPSAFYWYDAATTSYRLLPALRIFTNDGAGTLAEDTGSFLPTAAFLGGGAGTILDARSVVLGDLDGDDSLDLVVSGQTYYVYAYAGAPYGPQGLLAAGEHLATRVFLNDGAGKLADLSEAWLPKPVNGDLFPADAALLGDLDGDGDLDLVLASDSYPYSSGTSGTATNRPLRVLKCE